MIRISIYLLITLITCISFSDFVQGKQHDKSKKGDDVVHKAVNIVSEELKRIGKKRINELIKLAESKKYLELFSKKSNRDFVKNTIDSDDKALYATSYGMIDNDDPIIEEFANFFLDIKKNCKKMKKAYVYSENSEDEPIGHAFRLVIPAIKHKGNFFCDHYTVSFRLNLDGELLVTEWYSMPQNSDCQ